VRRFAFWQNGDAGDFRHGGGAIMFVAANGAQAYGFGPKQACSLPDRAEVILLNRTDRPAPMPGEADVKYLDGDFRVTRPGAFVRCAVTGVPIPLEELRYWSVDLQEAYATPDAVLQRSRSDYARKG
jgi:hypothetical protein